MRIWAFISQKGGSGKSTLATQLAVYGTQLGEKVIILDLDPQASAFSWHEARGEGKSPPVVRVLPNKLSGTIDAIRETGAFTLVIIDTAPHSNASAVDAIKATDLIVCPARPSRFDMTAMRDTIGLIELADSLGKTVGVLNAVHSQGAVKTYSRASALIERFGIRVAGTYVIDRVAYVNAVDAGKGVTELKDNKASKEIQDLWSELSMTPHVIAPATLEEIG